MQLLSEHEETTIVRWCERMDDWGFPLRLSLVKEMAAYLVKKKGNGKAARKALACPLPAEESRASFKIQC
jgi:hypothetical protein